MLFLAFIAAIIGAVLLNQNGSYTGNIGYKIISLIFNVIAVVLFAIEYGTARGIFIYLAAISLIGVVLTVFFAFKAKQPIE
ncbi:hypothetical protein GCM10008107_29340 [Psychrosphaera saromensis]|uniref:Uncharacterized protein n=1 Tax=Psychrosphaera saromensis TaxID=716813 RepID=A0A2S7UT60_9GAMM|nr:hypothetical protein [Psychrosphaera saromensis]PQJ52925.1 hypothetical protein BTO11_04160 [Psychrosphaera saromensis]GHB77853.1 hypothetical protein GCM10008107_29340 [Psychrosphaera saromensis]GLQ12919.1 hypothetical protein GCM10007917_03740 [Psychrosphaera saromensis]